MKDDGLAALVAMEPHTIALLLHHWNEIFIETSFRETPTAIVITASGEILAVMARPNHRAEDALWIDRFVGRYEDTTYYDQHAMIDSLARTLQDKGLQNARVGFEMGFVPAGIMDGMKTEQQLGFIKTAVNACEAGIQNMLVMVETKSTEDPLSDDRRRTTTSQHVTSKTLRGLIADGV